MKSINKMLLALAVLILTAGILVGCASGPKTDSSGKLELKSEDNVVTLEHKGTGVGMNPPAWFTVYFDRQIAGLEAMPEYKNQYCFVGVSTMSGQTAATTWATNFNVQQQIGQMMSTGIASLFKANESKVPDNADARRAYDNAINTLSNAQYSGARLAGDWWIKQRHESKGTEPVIDYTAYVFYTLDKKTLDDQLKTQLEALKRGNPALAAAFDSVSADMLTRGTEWTVEKN